VVGSGVAVQRVDERQKHMTMDWRFLLEFRSVVRFPAGLRFDQARHHPLPGDDRHPHSLPTASHNRRRLPVSTSLRSPSHNLTSIPFYPVMAGTRYHPSSAENGPFASQFTPLPPNGVQGRFHTPSISTSPSSMGRHRMLVLHLLYGLPSQTNNRDQFLIPH